jgi:hypothetical protein
MMAREILRLDSRGGCDTEHDPDFDPDAWPTGCTRRSSRATEARSPACTRRWSPTQALLLSMKNNRSRRPIMADIDAIQAVLGAHRSTDAHVTEEQITAAWAVLDDLRAADDAVVSKLATLAERQRRTLEALGTITADLRRERDVLRSFVVVCDCASTPPTMPTCRGEHLPTCPVARYDAALADENDADERQKP